MAHPCIECGGDCFCSGDIEDAVMSITPARCKTCGCGEDSPEPDAEFWEDDTADTDQQMNELLSSPSFCTSCGWKSSIFLTTSQCPQCNHFTLFNNA